MLWALTFTLVNYVQPIVQQQQQLLTQTVIILQR